MIPPREFIRSIRPFAFLSDKDLDVLLSGLEVEFFSQGDTIFERSQASDYVYIIHSGLIGLYDDETAVDYLTKDEIFGILTLFGRSMNVSAKALEETICYLIASRHFKTVLEANRRFAEFFSTLINRRFRSFKAIALDKKIVEEACFVLDVEKILYKKPVTCISDLAISHAAQKMESQAVSSIVAVDRDEKPIGILTHKDLKKVLIRGDKFDPVHRFMSSPVKTISAQATIFDAYIQMIEVGIDHLVVIKNAKVFGVITRKDIQIHLEPPFSIIKLYRKVHRAASLEELKPVLNGLKVSVARIVITGSNFFDLTKMLCSVHDAVVSKAMEITLGGRPKNNFIWCHMGSSGRKEEIIATDQDNALIFAGRKPPPFIEQMCDAMNAIGLPKCLGGYMASNGKWNQPLMVWQDYFKKWFAEPDPVHLRYLSVFLDMRPVYGETVLYDELLASIKLTKTPEAVKFMAEDAIGIKPPLGIFGIMGLHQGVDLKTNGIYPIINGARVLAVDNEIWGITNTRERLEALAAQGVLTDTMSHDLIESYGFMQDLRLRHQARAVLNQKPANNIVTAKEIPQIDLLILKESLKIVIEFQKFLMKRYKVARQVMVTPL
jgi:CBS domain-containing protein